MCTFKQKQSSCFDSSHKQHRENSGIQEVEVRKSGNSKLLGKKSPVRTRRILKFWQKWKKIWNASRICVSSLRRGHANLLCIVPILVYVPHVASTSIVK